MTDTIDHIVMDIHGIMAHLPHRYPFLMVDRIVGIEHDKWIKAYKSVSINEPFFQGHFPGLPVMPGVMIIESMAQAGACMILAGFAPEVRKESVFLFTGIDRVKFRKPVLPGDRLELHCTLLRHKMRLYKMHGTAHVDGALVAEAELTAAIQPKESF